MSRNSSGTYSLPAGNPVSTGTTITSTWANTTLSDIGTEVTNSLDRQGRGGMSAPLQLANGTVSAPAASFVSEPASGLYRAGANDVRMSVNSTDVAKWQPAAVTLLQPATLQAGVNITQSVTNGNGVTVTANGTGSGVNATGGSSGGSGVIGQGGTNGTGVVGVGTGTALGGSFTGGGTAGDGLHATASAANYTGIVGTGGAGGVGVIARSGTAATASVPQNALAVDQGHIGFTTVANPNSNVGFSNTLTAKNTPKAWATLTTNGAGAVTISDAFNISSATVGGSVINVGFATAMGNTSYCVQVTIRGARWGSQDTGGISTTGFAIDVFSSAGALIDPATNAVVAMVTVFGAQ